ncbi:hypothetical protein EJ02DRAFT_135080 [Clathrospora elynae]|uniref:Uncharacterized protein n=1 Tax=Clathrospora elynae TaxID=706981 RepID=A0A6A5SCY8_9PLEO|nr:hypothetical protein EJ02DRAFT_135080 [Clathrospora elynae]
MWRTGLLYLDRGDSSILAALRDAGYNTQQPPGSPSRRFSQASDTESALEGKLKHDIRSQQGVQHWVVPPDVNGLKFASPRASPRVRAADPADLLNPITDATLFEEPVLYSLDRIKEDEKSPDYFSYDDLEKSPSLKGEHDEPVQIQRRRPHHLRAPSTPTLESRLNSAQRASRSLPLRAKTNEGLLQLQANTSKPQRSANTHQRRISLGLPIKSAIAQAEDYKQTSPTSRFGVPSTPKRTASKKVSSQSPSKIQQERDLEYKHRHTFIGTASLDDFLEVLDVSPTRTTTKAAIVRAFILLASSERLLARQASLKPDGWSVIARTTSETVNVDYVEQAHAKLGSIVLRQFLDLITFNEEEEAGAMSVVEAFTAASHLDAQAGKGTGSKAKAFRSWMVTAQSE